MRSFLEENGSNLCSDNPFVPEAAPIEALDGD